MPLVVEMRTCGFGIATVGYSNCGCVSITGPSGLVCCSKACRIKLSTNSDASKPQAGQENLTGRVRISSVISNRLLAPQLHCTFINHQFEDVGAYCIYPLMDSPEPRLVLASAKMRHTEVRPGRGRRKTKHCHLLCRDCFQAPGRLLRKQAALRL